MIAILEKLLLEEEFLTNILINGKEIIMCYEDILPEQLEKITETKEKIINFFGGKQQFNEKIQTDSIFKEQVLEYSKEKFTYMLASEQSGQQQRIIWVLG